MGNRQDVSVISVCHTPMSDSILSSQLPHSQTEPMPDPLGEALLDYWRQPNLAAITVHIDISEDEFLSVSHFFRDENSISVLEKTALATCNGRVLDIGAGAGSLSLILQNRGLSVTAVDVSAGAVQVMQQRGLQNIQECNVFDFEGDGYDTLLLLMNGIGLVGTLEGLAGFLEQAKRWLNPGGQILLDSADILYMYEDEEGGYWIDLNGPYYGEVTYQMEYKQRKGEPFSWLFVSYDILSDYAEAAGYACEQLLIDENDQYLARLILKK